MKSKKVRIETVGIDEEAEEFWISVVDNAHHYRTIYKIKGDQLNVIPEEDQELELRWDDKVTDIELYYNDQKLVK